MTTPFINFSDPTTADGRKLWELGIKGLKSECDGSRKAYPLFKSQLRSKIKLCYWQDITTFLVDNEEQNLVDNPDLITMDMIQAQKEDTDNILMNGVVVPPPPPNPPPGQAGGAAAPPPAPLAPGAFQVTQEDMDLAVKHALQARMMHTMLTSSVTGDLESHIASLENQGITYDDGPTLLKLIQDKVRGKAVRQNMRNTREQIRNLKLSEHKWNVTLFNEALKNLLTTLKNNEDKMSDKDLVDLVIRNYKQVKHESFRTMIGIALDAAENADVDPDWEVLLEKGQNKYESLVAEGVWGKRTPQEEQIFALQAQVKALAGRQAIKSPGGTNKPPSNTQQGTAQPEGNNNKKKKRTYEDWQFKNTDNKSTVKKTITIKGESQEVIYYWCKHHVGGKGMWVRHKPENCKMKDRPAPAAPTTPPTLQARQTIIRDEQE